MTEYYYFTFVSTYQAIKAEKALSGEKWSFKMVPVPRSISSSCGTALRCDPDNAAEIKSLFQGCGVLIEGEHKISHSRTKNSLLRLHKKEV